MLFSKRNYTSALRFFRQVLASTRQAPEKITTDKHSPYNRALNKLKQKGEIKVDLEHRQQKYLNNIIKQDHRRIKRIVMPMMGFKSLNTAKRTIKDIEAMAMMTKQQCDMYARTTPKQVRFVNRLFHIYT